MNKFILGIITVLFFSIFMGAKEQRIFITSEEAEWIGNKIFHNECGGRDENIISWNEGEEFISLGIGHFIWYPRDKQGLFIESFPGLLNFMKREGYRLPFWLDEPGRTHCPWGNREEFLKNKDGPKAQDLSKFLLETKDLQLRFIVQRLENALPEILKAAPKGERLRIKNKFYSLALTLPGKYALVDYVNFKGEGISPAERYKGQGWGLLQVLEGMRDTDRNTCLVDEFVRVAKKLLIERVNNSPSERNEKRWLPGWEERINSYLSIGN